MEVDKDNKDLISEATVADKDWDKVLEADMVEDLLEGMECQTGSGLVGTVQDFMKALGRREDSEECLTEELRDRR